MVISIKHMHDASYLGTLIGLGPVFFYSFPILIIVFYFWRVTLRQKQSSFSGFVENSYVCSHQCFCLSLLRYAIGPHVSANSLSPLVATILIPFPPRNFNMLYISTKSEITCNISYFQLKAFIILILLQHNSC